MLDLLSKGWVGGHGDACMRNTEIPHSLHNRLLGTNTHKVSTLIPTCACKPSVNQQTTSILYMLQTSIQVLISESDSKEVSCEKRSTPASTWERLKQLVPIIKVFIPLIIFWAVFYQRSSTWVVQATQMDCYVGSLHIPPG